jgi:multidrug transporter EmrE-like cation transporter
VALGFVVTAALGVALLGEPLTAAKVVGIALVTAGVVVLARG